MITHSWTAWALVAALVIDRYVIDPDRLWSRLPHPVVGFGRLIEWGENGLRRAFGDGKRWEQGGGAGLVAGLVFIAGALGFAMAGVPVLGPFVATVLGAVLLAQKSLDVHVARVAEGLDRSIEDGRREVAMIVGRDVSELDASGVSRAAIESLAENFSDGVVAPALAFLLFGLPGIMIYKAVNTADSMIGHRNERYVRFGWAAARLDDLLNLLPARLTALFIAICSSDRMVALRTASRDSRLHPSPNAGWPEAAMAGGLDVSLGGSRTYEGVAVAEPPMNATGRRVLGPADIRSALVLYRRCLWLLFGLALAVALGTSDQVQNVFDHT